MAALTPQEEIRLLKEKIELQLRSNTLSAAQVANFTSAYNSISGGNGQLERLKTLLTDINLVVDDIADGLDFMTRSFLEDVAHLTKGRSLLNDHKSAMRKLADIAKETLDIRLGEQAIDERRFTKIQEQARKQIDKLKLIRDQYASEGKNTDEINAQIEATENLKLGFSKVEEVNKNLNKRLGSASTLLAGMDKALSKLGIADLGFKTALDETKQLGQAAAAQGEETFKKFSPVKTLIGKIGEGLSVSLSRANLITTAFVLLVKSIKASDEAAGNLAKDFNITYSEANRVRENLTAMANSSGELAVNTRGLQESMVAVGKSLGSNAVLNEKDLVTFTKLREMAGFQNEELIEMQKLTLATGGNLEDNVGNLLYSAKVTGLNNKVLLNEKDIMRDVAKASYATKLSLAGNPKALGEAAAQARALGMSLEQVDKTAESLLDFESSISNELAAELITGKDLNLEQARLYALNNNMAGLAREIAKNYGTAAEFSQMNRIQQDAAAKAVGMNREELAHVLTDQEALKGLSGKQAEDAQAALDAARARGMTDADIRKLTIEDLMKQQSMQERMNNAVEKLKELFVGIAESLTPILDTLTGVFQLVAYMMKPLGALMNWAGSFGSALKTVVGLLLAAGVAALFLNGSLTLGLGIAATLAAVGIGMEFFNSKIKPAATETRFADGGIVTKPITNATVGEAGSEAIIPLDSPAGKRMLTGGNNAGPANAYVDLSPLLEEMRALRQEQARANSKPTLVGIDYTKFGTFSTMNAFQTQ